MEMGEEVIILDTEIELPDHKNISLITDITKNSLISVMYPLKDDINSKLSDYASKNECIIYYPWS